MIAAVCSAPCAMRRRTESGLQARPLLLLDPSNARITIRNDIIACASDLSHLLCFAFFLVLPLIWLFSGCPCSDDDASEFIRERLSRDQIHPIVTEIVQEFKNAETES
jgi:hypothetical protein